MVSATTEPEVSPHASDPILQAARAAGSAEDALSLLAGFLRDTLRGAMKASGVGKPDPALAALEASGLDRFLVRSLAFGRVSHPAARRELDRLRRALGERRISAADLKLALVSFDENAQRLAVALGRSAGFRYPAQGNRARDSLLTFARSLHR